MWTLPGASQAACLCITIGDADPHAEGCLTGESAIAMLRKSGETAEATLAADLEALSGKMMTPFSTRQKHQEEDAEQDGKEAVVEFPEEDYHTPGDVPKLEGDDELPPLAAPAPPSKKRTVPARMQAEFAFEDDSASSDDGADL